MVIYSATSTLQSYFTYFYDHGLIIYLLDKITGQDVDPVI